MSEDKITAMWEEDGDLMRLKKFFGYIYQNDDIKERIKNKTLEKIANSNENEKGSQQEELPGPLVAPKAKNNVYFFSGLKEKLKIRKKTAITMISAAAVVVFAVYLGTTGILMQNNSKSIQEASITDKTFDTTQSTGMYNDAAMTAPNDITSGSGERGSLAGADSAASTFTEDQQSNLTKEKATNAINPIKQKLIYSLYVSLKAKDVTAAANLVAEKVTAIGGYVSESRQDNMDNATTAYLTLRIPADKFNSFKGQLSEFGIVSSQNLSSSDVSQEYFDSQTRLETWKAQEKRYIEILQQAKTVEDILRIEDSLVNVRTQIDSLEGQLKYWDNRVEYSEVTMNISPIQSNLTVTDPWQPISISNTLQAIKNAVIKTISFIWNAVNYVLVFIGYAIPIIILLGVVWLIYRQIKKQRNLKGK